MKEEHDRLSKKKTILINHEKNLRYQKEFEEHKARFFDLLFREKELVIEPLKSVDEFRVEAESLGHCVYSNDYFTRKESLMLSAKVNGERTETIEFSLSELEILQARGRGNKATKYNQRIINLINDNIPRIVHAISA